jgi:hypothetical protein
LSLLEEEEDPSRLVEETEGFSPRCHISEGRVSIEREKGGVKGE